MFEKFGDYMYYLLSSPFKQVNKLKNQWYLFFKIIGKLFDKNKAAFFLVREESMIATCSDRMLSVHAEDRGLTRYDGESYESFRRRIALYEEVCRLGGTRYGVQRAVESFGYETVFIIPCRYEDETRWAEFYVVIRQEIGKRTLFLIPHGILVKQVRKVKSVSAKDNYRYELISKITHQEMFSTRMVLRFLFSWWNSITTWNGMILYNGSHFFNAEIKPMNMKMVIKITVKQEYGKSSAKINMKHKLWYFNGQACFNGEKTADAYEKEMIV